MSAAYSPFDEMQLRALRVEAEVACLREDLRIAKERGDDWRAKFNADTDKLARLREELDEARAIAGLLWSVGEFRDLTDEEQERARAFLARSERV